MYIRKYIRPEIDGCTIRNKVHLVVIRFRRRQAEKVLEKLDQNY